MAEWFDSQIVGTGRLPFLVFFVAFILGFAFIRLSVRLIRAEVSWWPRNVTPGGLHIHHVTFGVVFMLVGGIGGLAAPDAAVAAISVLAAVFGIGSALVLDEFALILHLEDVYWTERGRTSVDAVFIAIGMLGLLLLGASPVGIDDLRILGTSGLGWYLVSLCISLGFVVVTLAKGKIWTGLLGIVLPILLLPGAIRLSRPDAPWARWRYRDRPRKLERARRRERHVREPVMRAKVRVQELVAGRHH